MTRGQTKRKNKMDTLEMEERILKRQLNDGEIDLEEYNRQMRAVEMEYENDLAYFGIVNVENQKEGP